MKRMKMIPLAMSLAIACTGADDLNSTEATEDAFTGRSRGLPRMTVVEEPDPEAIEEDVADWAGGEAPPARAVRVVEAESEVEQKLLPPGLYASYVSVGALNEMNDQFGRAVASGDFNGDGFADAAVAAPYEDIGSTMSAGAVFIFHGSGTGLSHEATLTQSGLSASETSDRFGWSLAVDDLNGDGRDDLAVGAPFEREGSDPHAGAVFVYRGSNGGLNPWHVLTQENLGAGVNEEGDRFGWALAAGDFDGDGWGEIAIGAPGEAAPGSPKAGVVFVVESSLLSIGHVLTLQQSAADGPEAHERFGSSLLAGRFLNTDARDDLVVGAMNERVGRDWAGAAYLYRGNESQHLVKVARLLQPGLKEHDDQFGRSFAAGDFNGDGGIDLAIGHPGENDGEGRVSIYMQTIFSLVHTDTLSFSPFGDRQPADRFGTSMTAEDVDGDGIDDLIVSAPNAGSLGDLDRAGRLGVFRGTMAGLTPLGVLSQTFLGGNDPRDRLGFALAAGDIDGDGYADILAGAPGETVEAQPRAGAAYVYAGTGGSPFISTQVVQNEE